MLLRSEANRYSIVMRTEVAADFLQYEPTACSYSRS